MTRKRRISEAVATCNVRDPLNLKAVTSEPEPLMPEESAAKVPNVLSCGNQVSGDSSQNTSTANSRKGDDFRTRHMSISQQKSLPPFTTPPRLIKPLLARNPKDPLDLLSSGRPEEANVPVSRTHKVPSPVAPVAGNSNNNLASTTNDGVPKPPNNRKRRRNRSMALSEAESRPPRTNAGGEDISPTTKLNVGKVPTFAEPIITKSAKKSRRGNRRRRKRRHGGKKKVEPSSNITTGTKPEDKIEDKQVDNAKAPTPKKRPPSSPLSSSFVSPLTLLCSSIRSLFSKCQVLHIGACGDNGSFSLRLATHYGAERVVGIDRCMKRIRVARRMLGSVSGLLSLNSTANSAGELQKKSKIFPRSFPVCFGPIGPDVNNPLASTLLRSVEFSYVSDYTSILPPVLAENELPPSTLWDTIILQERVVSSILCNPSNGPVAVHRLLTQISNSLRTGGHLVLVLGRLRWQKHLKTLRSLSASQPSTESVVQDENGNKDVAESTSSGIPVAAQLHPLTQLRKFFRFRLVRRLASSLSSSRLRRPSSVSWRGISPFQNRHGNRNHLLSHIARPQSLLSTTSSIHGPNNNGNGENGKIVRRHGGSHRIVFVLQKKANEPAAATDDKSLQQTASEQCTTTTAATSESITTAS